MKIHISINFEDDALADVARRNGTGRASAEVLRDLADRFGRFWSLESGQVWPLRDSNGNRIGTAEIVEG